MSSLLGLIKTSLIRTETSYRQTVSSPPEERNPTAFVRELLSHLIAEELVITPVLDTWQAAGSIESRERVRKDYLSIKEKLLRLITFDPSSESAASSLRAIWVDMEPHLQEEARSELVWLQQGLSEKESEDLAREYEGVRNQVKTRCRGKLSADDETRTILEASPRELREMLLGKA